MGAHITSNQKQKIYFIMQKQIDFGKAIYVVGNISELGCWSLKKALRLSWFKNHYWTGFISLSTSQLEHPIEYKYVIANWDNPQQAQNQWEAGKRNRIIQGSLAKSNIICENTWNMEKIIFNLMVPDDMKTEEYSVIGDCKQLGSWKRSYKLNLNQKKDIIRNIHLPQNREGKEYVIYSFTFQIFREKSTINYYYIKKNHGVQIERNPGRKYQFQADFHYHPKCLKVAHLRGDTQMFEICNFKQLNYSKVTQNILLGSYVCMPEDFKLLKNQEVSSILSIQTSQDFATHKITQDYIQAQASRNNIKIYNYAIQDMNKKDFIKKCHGAVELLQRLVQQKQRVYVHCSAGKYRSPQIVVLFLILAQNYFVEQAIQMVKSRHRFAKPNLHTVKHCLTIYQQKKQFSKVSPLIKTPNI